MSRSLAEYAKNSKIPARTLHFMKDQGFIHDPLNHDDLVGLALLEKVWCRREVLRPQVARLSKTDRQRLIRTADLPTKWERYAYSRFRNQQAEKSLPMRTVIMEIENTFGFQPDQEAIRKLYKARNRAQVDRHREKILAGQQQETSYRAQTKK